MSFTKKHISKNRSGAVLIVSLIFVLIFSALAVSMAALSGNNVELSDNQRKVNSALAAAQSGLKVVRYYFSGITVPGTVSPELRLSNVASQLQNSLSAAGVSNTVISYDSGNKMISSSSVSLNSQENQTFSTSLSYGADYDTVVIDVTGSSGEFSRQVRATFNFVTIGNGVFDYGVATKGPLHMTGQAEIEGTSLAIEGSVYIEGDNATGDAFSISNNASVAGDVTIANEYATYTTGNKSSVGGATGDEIGDHIHVGTDYVDFPTPDAEYFRSFATGGVINDNQDWDNDSVLNNMIISANTNPTFAGDVIINGILFVEMPNVVKFAGKSVVNGMIVASGDITDNSGTNSIYFDGQVQGNDASALEGAQFDAIKQETGTFILAPGFGLGFSGQSLNMNGAIAGNGVTISGQATGNVNGSIINYSPEPMTMTGNTTLTFNRSGIETNPAGFVSNKQLAFVPASYSEVH